MGGVNMSVRSDREREIARAMRAMALEHYAMAADATAPDDRRVHEQIAWVHDEAARQHRRLATHYDNNDGRRLRLCGGALV